MTPAVHVLAETESSDFTSLLTTAAIATLRDQGVEHGSLSVVITDERRMRQLNRQFAGEDHPTDVLSFPAGHQDPASGEPEHGDVVLCLPLAQRQARAAGHSLADELMLLTVHGVLHLMGHDHIEESEKTHMSDAQGRILQELGSAVEARLA